MEAEEGYRHKKNPTLVKHRVHHRDLAKATNRIYTVNCTATSLAVTYSMLPPQRFQTGHPIYTDEDREMLWLLHANHMFGAKKKVEILKKHGLWCNTAE